MTNPKPPHLKLVTSSDVPAQPDTPQHHAQALDSGTLAQEIANDIAHRTRESARARRGRLARDRAEGIVVKKPNERYSAHEESFGRSVRDVFIGQGGILSVEDALSDVATLAGVNDLAHATAAKLLREAGITCFTFEDSEGPAYYGMLTDPELFFSGRGITLSRYRDTGELENLCF